LIEAQQVHIKEAKERKSPQKLNNRNHNGPSPGRKESTHPASPDVSSSPKKTKKKLKIVA
jgi:hypothetical protein